MAAPSNAYQPKNLIVKLDETQASIQAAILHSNISLHKSRFYLDDLLVVRYPDESDGFIGIVEVGSPNYYMHNIARHGVVKTATNKVTLNDAGLNTLGRVQINNYNLRWANNVRLNVTFKSAWYVNTTSFGLRYRIFGSSNSWSYHWMIGESLPQQAEITSNRLFDTQLAPGQIIEVEGVIQNPEGIYVSSYMQVVLEDRVFEYDSFFRTQACNDSGQFPTSFWLKEGDLEDLSTVTTVSSVTGIRFWKNIDLTIPADSGWYIGIDNDKSFFVDPTGQVTHYEVCTIAPPSVSLAVEEVSEGVMSVVALLPTPWSSDLVIVGRIDVDPNFGTLAGKNFVITIPQGQYEATDPNFEMNRETGVTYYWLNLGTTPSGFVIEKQMPI